MRVPLTRGFVAQCSETNVSLPWLKYLLATYMVVLWTSLTSVLSFLPPPAGDDWEAPESDGRFQPHASGEGNTLQGIESTTTRAQRRYGNLCPLFCFRTAAFLFAQLSWETSLTCARRPTVQQECCVICCGGHWCACQHQWNQQKYMLAIYSLL